MQTVTYNNILKFSTNLLYECKTSNRLFRKEAENFYRLLVLSQKLELHPVKTTVDLKFKFYFTLAKNKINKDGKLYAGRLYDSSNCSGMAKCIEDGLVDCGILKGDTPKYVREIGLKSSKTDKDYDFVVVDIIPC